MNRKDRNNLETVDFQTNHRRYDSKKLEQNFSDSGGDCESGPGCDDASGSGDSCERDSDWRDQKFKLDRKKLETFHKDHGIRLDEFFARVKVDCGVRMSGTSSIVSGQRLRKDPSIKICGKLPNVERAKSAILTKLSPKCFSASKVVLKVDIGHSEHSHIIGKSGNSIKAVMEKTCCHIHFPDSNRTNADEKSNQVSISGQMHKVEQARSILRNMQQLELSFELPLSTVLNATASESGCSGSSNQCDMGGRNSGGGSNSPAVFRAPDLSNPILQKIGQKYEINISVDKSGSRVSGQGQFELMTGSCRGGEMTTTGTIVFTTKGAVSNTEKVKTGTQELIDYLTQNFTAPIIVQTTIDVSPQHQSFVFGKERFNIQRIINKTNCLVSVPDPTHTPHLPPAKRGTVYIQGNIDSVVAARQMLIAHLPVVFLFDVPGDLMMRQCEVEDMSAQFDCQINVKYRPRQQSSSVVVKTFEKNVSVCYEIRRKLGFTNEANPAGEPTVVLPSHRSFASSSTGGAHNGSSYQQFTSDSSMPMMSMMSHAAAAAAVLNFNTHSPSSPAASWPFNSYMSPPSNTLDHHHPNSASYVTPPNSSLNSTHWHNQYYQQAMLNSMLQSQQQQLLFNQMMSCSTAAVTSSSNSLNATNNSPSFNTSHIISSTHDNSECATSAANTTTDHTSIQSTPSGAGATTGVGSHLTSTGTATPGALTAEQLLVLQQLTTNVYGTQSPISYPLNLSLLPQSTPLSLPLSAESQAEQLRHQLLSPLAHLQSMSLATSEYDQLTSANLSIECSSSSPPGFSDRQLNDFPDLPPQVFATELQDRREGAARLSRQSVATQRRRESRDNLTKAAKKDLKVATEHSGDERCSVSSDGTSPDKVTITINNHLMQINNQSYSNGHFGNRGNNSSSNNGPEVNQQAACLSSNHVNTCTGVSSSTNYTTNSNDRVDVETGPEGSRESKPVAPKGSVEDNGCSTKATNKAVTANNSIAKFVSYADCAYSKKATNKKDVITCGASTCNLRTNNNSTSAQCTIDQSSFNTSLNQPSFNASPSVDGVNNSVADLLMNSFSTNNVSQTSNDAQAVLMGAQLKDGNNNARDELGRSTGRDDLIRMPSSRTDGSSTADATDKGNKQTSDTNAAAVADFNESGRHPLADSAFFNSLLKEQDRKTLAAQLAVEQDVGSRPEIRVPNPVWSGLGFSRSMPLASLKCLGLGGEKQAFKDRTNGSEFINDHILEDEDSILTTCGGVEDYTVRSPGDPWKDDVVHPSNPFQKVSKHGAPGDKPTISTTANFGLIQPGKDQLQHRSLMSRASNSSHVTLGNPNHTQSYFAASNQVDVLSKLYRRSGVLSSYHHMGPSSNINTPMSGTASRGGLHQVASDALNNENVGGVNNSQRVETVADVLRSSGLAKYIEIFRDQEIFDMDTFLSLTEKDLKDLGITFGARRKLELEIKSRKGGRLQPVLEQHQQTATAAVSGSASSVNNGGTTAMPLTSPWN